MAPRKSTALTVPKGPQISNQQCMDWIKYLHYKILGASYAPEPEFAQFFAAIVSRKDHKQSELIQKAFV